MAAAAAGDPVDYTVEKAIISELLQEKSDLEKEL
jgi:hypothetical protein